MSFGENLTNLRRQKGWSQDDLANNLDLSRQAISKWENETSKPDIDNIKKISKIFSIKIDDLINNELPDDKAVTLDVKKEEKREKTITIIKLMIIAVIILYVISVIYKFASLLVIVNGVQKYANLNNYHYVITTYDENGLAEEEEYWFKDGESKTISSIFNKDKVERSTTYINYNTNEGYTFDDENNKAEIDISEYLITNLNYNNGGQLFSNFPIEIRKSSYLTLLGKSFIDCSMNIYIRDESIDLCTDTCNIKLEKDNLLPKFAYYFETSNDTNVLTIYEIELNNVDKI